HRLHDLRHVALTVATAAAVATLAPCATVIAQDASKQDASGQNVSSVAGRVVKPGGDSVLAVADAWVTLHRVGTDRAGPVDSTRTNHDGRYRFDYRRTGAGDAIYFVSSSHHGVAYFSHPLRAGADSGEDAEIAVFDTTSRAIPITVRGRHIIVSRAAPDGERTVTEVFELTNDTSVTKVAPNESVSAAVFSALIPSNARSPVVADGDIPAAAVKFADSRVLVYAALAPGMKQLAFHYDLPSDAFPLHIPLERGAVVLEILAEDSTATVTGAGLRAVAPVAIEGHTFRRFLAGEVRPNSVTIISVPELKQPMELYFVAGLTLVIGGAMTLALARTLRRR
ncbi:MAG: hypothetical protein M3Z30_09580, partial [Gemmatimonadota bacterium]|nr:hypothetical protein [Gemmatimonadota bacterium]